MSPHHSYQGRKPDNDHQSGQNHPENAESHVPVQAASGHESYLRDEQEYPAGKECSMDMNEWAGQFGMKNASEIIRVRETDENDPKNEKGHDCKEIIVGVFSKRLDRRSGHVFLAIVNEVSRIFPARIAAKVITSVW